MAIWRAMSACAGAAARAEVLRCAVAAERIAHRQGAARIVTISAGASSCVRRQNEHDLATLITTADHVLYLAKAGGRDCVRRVR